MAQHMDQSANVARATRTRTNRWRLLLGAALLLGVAMPGDSASAGTIGMSGEVLEAGQTALVSQIGNKGWKNNGWKNDGWNNNWNKNGWKNNNWNNKWVVRGWKRQPYYGQFISGIALGTILGVAAVGVAPIAPGPELCWYWTSPYRNQGYWDYCY